MDKQSENRQRGREYATYRYLEALDSGDINAIIEVLHQALYDAPLEQMILEAHQAYFQEEQVQKDALMGTETQAEILAFVPLEQEAKRKAQRPVSLRWMHTLVAVLIVGVLIGSFLTLLNLRRLGLSNAGVPTVTPACQSYPLKQFDVQYHTSADSLTVLQAVTAVSLNDAWAVGFSSSAPTSPPVSKSPLIEHWNGRSWQFVPSPTITNGNGVLVSVAAASASNVWAVGYSFHDYPTAMGQSLLSVSRTLIEHWDGKSWQIIASPNGSAGNGLLQALTVISQDDIWAVGSFEDARQVVHPLLEHWNGTNWHIVSSGGGSSIGWFYDVAAASANDIWAVGLGRNEGEKMTHSLVEHWNGSQWQVVPTSPSMRRLASVSVISARNVWVIGSDANGYQLIEHWDGQQWKDVALPSSLEGKRVNLSKVIAGTSDEIWAVGETQESAQAKKVLVLHWDGKRWQQMRTPTLQLLPSLPNSLANGLAVYGGRQLWIVGYAVDEDGGYTSGLILGQLNCS